MQTPEDPTRRDESGALSDPRGSLLLSLWRWVVLIAGTILCLRDPDEVAHSLATRESMGAERAAALWLRYLVAAWQNCDEPLIVRFDEPYEQPRELMRRLSAFAGLPPATEDILQKVTAFVDPSLRHYASAKEPPGPLMRLARAAHVLLATQPPEVVHPIFSALSNGWRLEAHLATETAARTALRAELLPSVLEILKASPRE